jgi:hypothetical protein
MQTDRVAVGGKIALGDRSEAAVDVGSRVAKFLWREFESQLREA